MLVAANPRPPAAFPAVAGWVFPAARRSQSVSRSVGDEAEEVALGVGEGPPGTAPSCSCSSTSRAPRLTARSTAAGRSATDGTCRSRCSVFLAGRGSSVRCSTSRGRPGAIGVQPDVLLPPPAHLARRAARTRTRPASRGHGSRSSRRPSAAPCLAPRPTRGAPCCVIGTFAPPPPRLAAVGWTCRRYRRWVAARREGCADGVGRERKSGPRRSVLDPARRGRCGALRALERSAVRGSRRYDATTAPRSSGSTPRWRRGSATTGAGTCWSSHRPGAARPSTAAWSARGRWRRGPGSDARASSATRCAAGQAGSFPTRRTPSADPAG